MSGALIRLPFDARGFAPRMRKKSVRSTSGTGINAKCPNMRSAASICGNWSAELAE